MLPPGRPRAGPEDSVHRLGRLRQLLDGARRSVLWLSRVSRRDKYCHDKGMALAR